MIASYKKNIRQKPNGSASAAGIILQHTVFFVFFSQRWGVYAKYTGRLFIYMQFKDKEKTD
jgi:hypothetical protein